MARQTVEEFIRRAQEIHGKKYDYSNVNYTNNRTSVPIKCPSHGLFLQTPYKHVIGRGCSKCVGRNRTESEFISECKKTHDDKYDYSHVVFTNLQRKISIICPKHGVFIQRANEHLTQNHGCPKCVGKNKTKDEFVLMCNKIHNDKYDYSKTEYKTCKDKITIICPNHGEFLQTPDKHLCAKEGCPKCLGIISKQEMEFLDYVNIPNTIHNRQVKILRKKVDGVDLTTNTIYEFLGDYWHGNPSLFMPHDINKRCHKTYGKLYDETVVRFQNLHALGYNIKYIWEKDWELWNKNNRSYEIPVREFHPTHIINGTPRNES
jgi:hypothetical protein